MYPHSLDRFEKIIDDATKVLGYLRAFYIFLVANVPAKLETTWNGIADTYTHLLLYVRIVYTMLCILAFCFVFYDYTDTQNKRPIKCVVLATISFYSHSYEINLIFANSMRERERVYGFLFCLTA